METTFALVGIGLDGRSIVPHNRLMSVDFPAEKCPQKATVSLPACCFSLSSLTWRACSRSPAASIKEASSVRSESVVDIVLSVVIG